MVKNDYRLWKKKKVHKSGVKPFSEWKFFVSIVRNNHDSENEAGALDQTLMNIEADYIQSLDCKRNHYDGQDMRDKDR